MRGQLDRDLEEVLAKLAPDEREQVLRHVRSRKGNGVPGATLLKYVGRIPEEDLRQIEAAIAQDFERVHGEA
jgi:hypothetical protein